MWRRRAMVLLLVLSCLAIGSGVASPIAAQAFVTSDIIGPTGSGRFGSYVDVLPNGNIVVTDPYFDSVGGVDVGAVRLYDGSTHQLISTLQGSHPNDFVGRTVTVVGNSNFLVASPSWDNGLVQDAGAVTFVNGTTGLNGEISAANSLVGSHANDEVGFGVTVLTNGNYVVNDAFWDNGVIVDAGFATLASGATGKVGVVNNTNSLVGTTANDHVGWYVTALTNGNYVVVANQWTNTGAASAGAVTWGSGISGVTGMVSSANSLVGVTAGDFVGRVVVPLTNGNYVVGSPAWDFGPVLDVGAATWLPGSAPFGGTVTAGNSILGAFAGDAVGDAIIALTNGNYVVGSTHARNGGTFTAGAATWGNGVSGTVGLLTGLGSIRGSTPNDQVASTLVALTNGNYVVGSALWDNGATTDAGAATVAGGTGATSATVTAGNSLVGTHATDHVGQTIVALTNGDYVALSPLWDNGGLADVGAATWGSGDGSSVGPVASGNSLTGSSAGDFVGLAALPLTNGNYVVKSSAWIAAGQPNAGAATWRPGTSASPAVVSAANSLVGSQTNDGVGADLHALPTGDYVVNSGLWNNGATPQVGAVTWGSGTSGVSGLITSANSLIGSTAHDALFPVVVFEDGSYTVIAEQFDNGLIFDAGAVPFAPPTGLTGFVTPTNSFIGQAVGGGTLWSVAKHRTASGTYIIGRASENRVTFVQPSEFTPLSPARLLDTRPGLSTIDGLDAGGGQRSADSTYELTVAGRGGVAADAVAVALNVTAVDSGGNGYVTVFPCGSPRPLASNLNVTVGATVPNAVLAKIGNGGKVCLFVLQPTHLVVDVDGFFPPTSTYRSVNPARILETRSGLATIDGQQEGGGPIAGGTVLEVQVTGRASVPANATAVALNVTVTEPAAAGYVTVFPCGSSVPTASSLNIAPGATVANLVVSRIGTGGKVCIYTQSAAQFIADVNGFFPSSTHYTSLVPARLLETRSGLGTIDGQFAGVGLRTADSITTLRVAGRGGVPFAVATVVLNVTVTEAGGRGYVTVYPCGIGPPLASNLNFVPAQTIPNAVIVKVGTSGDVCLLTSQPTHLVVDVVGYLSD